MGFEATSNTIRSRFKTLIEDAESIPTQYPNAPEITRPDGLWVMLSIQEGDSVLFEIGGTAKTYRNFGVFAAQIFSPLGVGVGDALALADTIATSFRMVTVSSVEFRVPRVIRLGQTQSAKWYQINLLCPFKVQT